LSNYSQIQTLQYWQRMRAPTLCPLLVLCQITMKNQLSNWNYLILPGFR